MSARWTEWKSYPDAYHGEYIEAPIGPGLYEVCYSATRQRVAFGCTTNVARTLAEVLKPRKARRWSLFRRAPAPYTSGELEYRAWPTATLADAKVAIDQIVNRRDAVLRRFAQAPR
jgi:hypothetical protein